MKSVPDSFSDSIRCVTGSTIRNMFRLQPRRLPDPFATMPFTLRNIISLIYIISSIFMFPRSRNLLLTFLQIYHVWVTSKIPVNFWFNRYSNISSELPYLGDLENLGQSPVQEVLGGTDGLMVFYLENLNSPSLWPSRIDTHFGRNKLSLIPSSVGYISYPTFIEPTITWVSLGFSGYIWLDTKIVLKNSEEIMKIYVFEVKKP